MRLSDVVQSDQSNLQPDPYSLPTANRAAARNELEIYSRQNPFTQIRQTLVNPNPSILVAPSLYPSGQAAQIFGQLARIAESVPANIGLGVQQRRGVSQTFADVLAGLRGERPAELGDIPRASGLPFLSSRPVATSIGLLSSLAPGLAISPGRKLATGVDTGFTNVGKSIAGGLGEVAKTSGAYTKAIVNPAGFEGDVVQLAKRARGEYAGGFLKSISPKYTSQLQALPGKLDVTQRLEPLVQMITDPETGTEVNAVIQQAIGNAAKVGDTTLQRVLQSPELMKSVTPYEADQIATTLKQTPSALRFFSQNPNVATSGAKNLGRMGTFDRQLSQISNGIESDITALHPTAYPAIKKAYGEAQQAARVLTPQFTERGNRLFTNIKQGFGGGEVGQRLEQALPPQTVADIKRVHRVEVANPREVLKKFLLKQR